MGRTYSDLRALYLYSNVNRAGLHRLLIPGGADLSDAWGCARLTCKFLRPKLGATWRVAAARVALDARHWLIGHHSREKLEVDAESPIPDALLVARLELCLMENWLTSVSTIASLPGFVNV